MVSDFALFVCVYDLLVDETTMHRTRPTTTATNTRTRLNSSSIGRKKSGSIRTSSSRRKREQQMENFQNAMNDLLNHFSQRNLEAITRVIRNTLEKIRKRITSTTSYGTELFAGQHHREAPVFKIFAELIIPNVTVRPSIDEVQMYLNRSVQTIISVSKCISQWDKDRSSQVCRILSAIRMMIRLIL